MYCKKCGAENKENANFCCKCGSPLDFNNKKSKKLTDKQKNKKKKNKGIYFAIFAVCLIVAGMVFLIQTQIRKQKEIKQAVQVCLDDLQQKNWSDLFQESDATKEEMKAWSEDVQKALTGEQKEGIIEVVNLIADHAQIDGKVSFGRKKVTYTVTIPDFTDFMKSIDLDRINTKEKLMSEVEEYLAETEPKTTKVELEYKKTDGSWMTNYMDKAFIHAVTGNLLIGYMESEQKTEIQNMLENNFESVYWDFLKENSADNAYFNLTDIDGDGIPELLTATEDHLYYNNQVNGKCAATGCTLYAFLGGSVKKLVYGESRYCYPILVENNQLMFPQRMKGLVVSLDHGTLVGYGEYYEKMTDVMYQVDLKELNLEEGFLEGSFCLDADPSQVGVPVEDLGYNFYFYEDDNGAILDFEENNEENRQKNFLIEMEETSDSSSQETDLELSDTLFGTYTATKDDMTITVDFYEKVNHEMYMIIEHRPADIDEPYLYYDYVVGKVEDNVITVDMDTDEGKLYGEFVLKENEVLYTLLSHESGSEGTVSLNKTGLIDEKYVEYFYGTWSTDDGQRVITQESLNGKTSKILSCEKEEDYYYLYYAGIDKSDGQPYFYKALYKIPVDDVNSMISYSYNPAWGGYTGGYGLEKISS